MEHNELNNQVTIVGTIDSEISFSHESHGEDYYIFTAAVMRHSGTVDKIPVMVSATQLLEDNYGTGDLIEIIGQYRSYNNYINGKSTLVLMVFARSISHMEECDDTNSIYLNGALCKNPVFRTTPFGREVCDILLAVNRGCRRSDYIPIIVWGNNARFAQTLSTGDNVQIWGRIQSREYQKKLSDEQTVTKTAYEVSVGQLKYVRPVYTDISD